ncbi:unnamed protein product [Colias eurytheme]|nr:unnamed protein product [Colias eurytheme]
MTTSPSSNPLTSTLPLTPNRKSHQLSRFVKTIASSNASSHRPTTYRADVVKCALISRDDVKRQSEQVQTINCIEVSDSNE